VSEGVRRRFRDSPPSGLGQQFVQSVDHAVKFLRGLVPAKAPSAKSGAPHDRDAPGRRSAPSKEGLRRLELSHKQLVQQVSNQERELERMHLTITSGAAGATGTSGTGDRLTNFIETARQLRERIQEKRLEIARLERRIARERQLLGMSASAEPSSPDTPTAGAGKAGARASANGSRSRVTDATITAALRRVNFADRAERTVVEGIAEGLLSDNVDVRRQAMSRIGGRPRPAIPLLLVGANDPDERVRLAALGGLTGQRGAGVVEVFRRFLGDESPALRLAALRGLASVDERAFTSSELATTLEDVDPGIRRAAAAAAVDWCRDKLSSPVMRGLRLALYDEDEAVRVSAAEVLGTTCDDKAVFCLIRAASDPSEAVREAALRSLRASVGAEIDSVVAAAPAEARVDALKVWWRGTRVRLRTGSNESERAHPASTAREVLESLASLKTAGGSPERARARSELGAEREARQQPEAAGTRSAIAAVDVTTSELTLRETKTAENDAAARSSAAPEAAAAVTAAAAPEATPGARGKSAPPADPEAGAEKVGETEGETSDFESMFQESEGDEESTQTEGEGGGEYESILGGEET
jgi:HEAT repeat protein